MTTKKRLKFQQQCEDYHHLFPEKFIIFFGEQTPVALPLYAQDDGVLS